MLKIKFYNNGYEFFGHINPVKCGEASGMAFMMNGFILDIDNSAKCFAGDNKGYTGLYFDSENMQAHYLYEIFKEDFVRWAEDCWEDNEYQINYIGKNIAVEQIEKEAESRKLN